MNRRIASLFVAAVAVAVLAQPASALEPLPPSAAVLGMQQVRQYLAPLAVCQVDALIDKERTLVAAATGGTTISAIISSLGLPSGSDVHDLALLTLAVTTHGADKEHPERRALVQPLEKSAASAAASIPVIANNIDAAAQKLAPGSCAGLAPVVVPTPDVYAISVANLKFAAKRKAIEAYLTANMGQRLLRISNALQNDGDLTTSANVLAAVKTQFNDVQLSAGQLDLLEYVAIQKALDGRLATGRVTTAEGLLRDKQIGAYADALRSLQANMPTSDSIVQNIQG